MLQKEKFLLLTPDRFLQKPLSEGDISWIGANGGQRTTHTFALEYQHYTMHAILRAVLPTEIEEVPHAFETVGHIAHLNLRQEQLPYKEVIGKRGGLVSLVACSWPAFEWENIRIWSS